MKKILSFTLALCIAVTSLFTGTVAMADTAKPTTQEIKAKITGAADYLVTDGSAYTVDNAAELLTLLNSGKDMSAYKDSFAKSVKENLDANNAKLIKSDTQWSQDENGEWQAVTTSVESPAAYAAVILDLYAFGYDAQSFEGYNLVYPFSQSDVSTSGDNPYYYYITLQAAEKAKLGTDFTKKVCDSFVSSYYVKGSGLDYYGYSCDNTAMFIVTIAPYYDSYKELADDALALLETYRADGGYFYSSEYNTVNADSTALALAAYSAVGNTEKAQQIYADLCKFEGSKTGVFTYTSGGEDSDIATKDALLGLEMFYASLPQCYDGHKYTAVVTAPTCTADGYTTYTCSVCGDTYKDNTVKATGHNFTANAAKCTVCGTPNPGYVIPKVTGLAVKSKSTSAVRLTWDKLAYADSYVIYQYNDTAKKYEKVATAKGTATSCKISGLTSGAVYKYRISAVVNGKEGAKSNYLKTCANPRQSSILKASSAAKKKITVKIKASVCTGYQVEVSTDKKFENNCKMVTVAASKTTSKTVAVASSGKTYYVRVRAYTKAGGVKSYGKWSAVKTVKAK